ncbi:MAG TPA: CPBP family intramembrane glutamic endopeptidase [Actinophytocola sp.]|uniref:CPBP family intramembrane glutamic endopeptidase n=1 Tax=Actinophytocola sp. TaxID=1872138 RepID=UPI002DDCB62A|nr:CPBP family intramembrane glutamic endopeptidase [Actinophytocola sp.]HEV2777968.1 CPBP family intramembrane glutamic endopeptidase [Actinophytocola sp.]
MLAAVLLLAAATTLANRVLPGWAYPVCGLCTVAGLLGLAQWSGLRLAEVGLDRRELRRAAAVGLIGAGLVGLAFGIALAVPVLRTAFDDDRLGMLGPGALLWVTLIRIPLGTVLLEEIAFRGVLPALLGAGDRWRWGPVLGASALFGLWHVLPSLALRHNAAVNTVLGGASTVLLSVFAMLAAAVAGVIMCWLRYAGRGVLAPALVHVATNSGGVLAAWSLGG